MRRCLIIMLCIFLSLNLLAIGFDELDINGEMRTRAFYLYNYKANGIKDIYFINRSLIKLSFSPVEETEIGILFGYTRYFGKNKWYYQQAEPGPFENLSGIFNEIGLYNAYFKIPLPLNGKATIGRQFLGDRDDAFFFYGPQRGRFLEVTSLDAIKIEYLVSNFNTYFAVGKKNEYNLDTLSKDIDIVAIGVKNEALLKNNEISLNMYSRIKEFNDKLYLPVVRVKGNFIEKLGHDIMFGINFGSKDTINYTGWLGRAIFNFKFSTFKFTGGYVYVSGDTNTVDGNDGNFRRISRDCFYNMAILTYELLNDVHPENVTNVTIPFGGIDYSQEILGGNLKFTLIGCYLQFAVPSVIAGTLCKDKGKEVNFRIEYQFKENLTLELILARFIPGDQFKAAFGSSPTFDKPYDQATFDFTLNF